MFDHVVDESCGAKTSGLITVYRSTMFCSYLSFISSHVEPVAYPSNCLIEMNDKKMPQRKQAYSFASTMVYTVVSWASKGWQSAFALFGQARGNESCLKSREYLLPEIPALLLLRTLVDFSKTYDLGIQLQCLRQIDYVRLYTIYLHPSWLALMLNLLLSEWESTIFPQQQQQELSLSIDNHRLALTVIGVTVVSLLVSIAASIFVSSCFGQIGMSPSQTAVLQCELRFMQWLAGLFN